MVRTPEIVLILDTRLSCNSWAEIYDYWILGKNVRQQEHRWSVIRDVLHWVD